MNFIQKYSLSLILILLFLLSLVAQGIFQYKHEYNQAVELQHELTIEEFNDSFLASVFENWQSEFLQLFSFVILSAILIHKGSPQSKDGDEETRQILRRIEKIVTQKQIKTKK